jgi:hypothetical protein
LTDRVTVISSGIENAKLLKIQALAAEFVKLIDPDVPGYYEQEVCS